jgi:hypothetical protein
LEGGRAGGLRGLRDLGDGADHVAEWRLDLPHDRLAAGRVVGGARCAVWADVANRQLAERESVRQSQLGRAESGIRRDYH